MFSQHDSENVYPNEKGDEVTVVYVQKITVTM